MLLGLDPRELAEHVLDLALAEALADQLVSLPGPARRRERDPMVEQGVIASQPAAKPLRIRALQRVVAGQAEKPVEQPGDVAAAFLVRPQEAPVPGQKIAPLGSQRRVDRALDPARRQKHVEGLDVKPVGLAPLARRFVAVEDQGRERRGEDGQRRKDEQPDSKPPVAKHVPQSTSHLHRPRPVEEVTRTLRAKRLIKRGHPPSCRNFGGDLAGSPARSRSTLSHLRIKVENQFQTVRLAGPRIGPTRRETLRFDWPPARAGVAPEPTGRVDGDPLHRIIRQPRLRESRGSRLTCVQVIAIKGVSSARNLHPRPKSCIRSGLRSHATDISFLGWFFLLSTLLKPGAPISASPALSLI
jgi:hypothetical protein